MCLTVARPSLILACMKTPLQRVRDKLAKRKGAALLEVATATGISYDTLLRIRDGKVDPAYSKVQTLIDTFWPKIKS